MVLIVYRRRKRQYCIKTSVVVNLVHAPRIAEKEFSNVLLPPLTSAWLPSNEILPRQLTSLSLEKNAPVVVIDSIKDIKQERLIRGKHLQTKPCDRTSLKKIYNVILRPLFCHARVHESKAFKALLADKDAALPRKVSKILEPREY